MSDLSYGERMRFIFKSTLCANDRLVLLHLNQYVGADGCCWPALKTISDETGLSIPTVRRSIDRLSACGVISRTSRVARGGRQTSNLYSVDWLSLEQFARTAPRLAEKTIPDEPQNEEPEPDLFRQSEEGEGISLTGGGYQADRGRVSHREGEGISLTGGGYQADTLGGITVIPLLNCNNELTHLNVIETLSLTTPPAPASAPVPCTAVRESEPKPTTSVGFKIPNGFHAHDVNGTTASVVCEMERFSASIGRTGKLFLGKTERANLSEYLVEISPLDVLLTWQWLLTSPHEMAAFLRSRSLATPSHLLSQDHFFKLLTYAKSPEAFDAPAPKASAVRKPETVIDRYFRDRERGSA